MLPKKGYMDIRPASGDTECALNRRGGVSISTFRSMAAETWKAGLRHKDVIRKKKLVTPVRTPGL